MRRLLGMVTVGALFVGLAPGAALSPEARAAAGDGAVRLRVVQDINGDGAYQPLTEVGVAGAPFTVTDAAGATSSGTTGADGTAVADLTKLTGGRYRVEVTPPTGSTLQPAPAGAGLSPLTSFVDVSDGKESSLTMGLWRPEEYCQDNPSLVTCALGKGDNTGGAGLLSFSSTLGNTSPGGPTEQLSTVGQQGAVFGIGTDRTGNVFMGSYVKRHTEYGPAGAVNAIYRYNTGVAGKVSTFVTLPGKLTEHSKEGPVPYIADDGIYSRVGREGLGDVDVSGDGSTLYAVNLNDSSLYVVPLQGTGDAVTAGTPKAFPIPKPAANCSGEWHPFGIGVRGSRVLVGGVCGAENTVTAQAPAGDPAKMTGFVYSFTGSAFNQVFSFPLDYPRNCAYRRIADEPKNCQPTLGGTLSAAWEAWNERIPAQGWRNFSSAPQPMLSNIEIADNGDLILGLRDRHADQQGNQTQFPGQSAQTIGIAAGDVLRACVAGGGFTLESNGSCGGVAGAHPDNKQGPGNGEFYDDEFSDPGAFHDQTTEGGLVVKPGTGQLWTTRFDVFNNEAFTQGVSQLNDEGATVGRIQLVPSPAADNKLFGKGNGLADLELLCDQAPVQLGDRVWFDTDGDGVQGPAEPALPGVTVQLLPCDGGAPLATKTTDANGLYYFGAKDGLKASTCYTVKFDYSKVDTTKLPGSPPVTALSWTKTAAGTNRGIDSNVDQTGTVKITTGKAGTVDHTIDAGVVGGLNKLGDFVWVDTDKNGIQDAGEPGVPGVPVTVKDDTGKVIGTATTDDAGKYLVGNLPDGTYQVCFDFAKLPPQYADYQLTKPNAAGHNGTDSAADPATKCTMTTTLGPDHREDLTLDAGIVPPVNRLGDFVWVDTNKNGIQDTGEPGVPGVPVTVKDDTGKVVGTVTTDDAGKYLFGDLPDGKYQVCFDLAKLPKEYADYQLTKPNAAGHNGTDSAADPASGCTMVTTLGAGHREDLTLDAGLVAPPNKLGDFVWVDTNKNGIQDTGEPGVPGVPVTVKDDTGKVVGTVTTDDAGKYSFGDLPDGKYQVCFDFSKLSGPYAEYQPTKQNVAGHNGTDSAADLASGCTMVTTLGVGHREDLTLDAGIVPPVNRVGDFVWSDKNKNGVQDPGEPGVPGVTVTLKGTDGKVVGMTKTDDKGKYLFESMPDGDYVICFDLGTTPKGTKVTKPNAAGHNGTDSAGDQMTGCTSPTKLGKGHRVDLTLDLGLIPAAAPVVAGHKAGLASTGLDVLTYLGIACVIVAAGVLLLFVVRRRRLTDRF